MNSASNREFRLRVGSPLGLHPPPCFGTRSKGLPGYHRGTRLRARAARP
jgi:hypothetical protein